MHIDLRNMPLEGENSLEGFFISIGEPAYRAKQVFRSIHKNGVTNIEEMTDLPKKLRERLNETAMLSPVSIVERLSEANTDKRPENNSESNALTTKYLLNIGNDTIIESVSMNHSYGRSLCVSSQAGCKMNCSFCTSAKGGFIRNLTAGEICAQVYAMDRDANNSASDNIVIMGSGEPFDNYDNVIGFIRLINHPLGKNIGMRHITVSTCGIIPGIEAFARDCPQVNLAVSLHAPNDEVRRKIMPIAARYPIGELFDACFAYTSRTHRRISFEYALIPGVNDTKECLRELIKRLKGRLCHVNLLGMNTDYIKGINQTDIHAFCKALTDAGIETTIRRSLGKTIGGACGQLKARYLQSEVNTEI